MIFKYPRIVILCFLPNRALFKASSCKKTVCGKSLHALLFFGLVLLSSLVRLGALQGREGVCLCICTVSCYL